MDLPLDNINWSFIEEIEKDIQLPSSLDDFQLDAEFVPIADNEIIEFINEMPNIQDEAMNIDEFLNDAFSTEDVIVEEMSFKELGDQKITITIPVLENLIDNSANSKKFSQNFSCLLCKLSYPNRFNLERHFNSRKHLKNENLFVENVDHIKAEELIVEEIPDDFDEIYEQSFTCKDCQKTFRNAYQLKKHQQSVHRVFKCDKCARGFKSEKEFQVHLERHQKSDNFQCAHCSKCFTNNTNLRRHEKVHLEAARTFECTYCMKNFNQKTNLVRHLKVHEKKIVVIYWE